MQQLLQGQFQSKIQNLYPQVENIWFKQCIDNCVQFKILCYYKFLIIKLELKKILHKKIVQIIYYRYISQNKLNFNSGKQRFGKNQKNWRKYFVDIMKQLKNIQILNLNLYECQLGQNEENLKCLKEGLTLVPNLTYLQLNLQANKLENKTQNWYYLKQCFKQFPKLEYLELNLNKNSLVNLNLIENIFKYQHNLRHLVLNLSTNSVGSNFVYENPLGNYLQHLSNLQYLKLNLYWNNLKDWQLGHGLQQLKKLNHLVLIMYYNHLGQSQINMKLLGEDLKLLENLQYLQLNLENNGFIDNQNYLQYIGDAFQKLQNLKQLQLSLRNNGLDNISYIQEGFMYLNNLEILKLNLDQNNLGINQDNMIALGESLKQIKNLKHFELNVRTNNFEQNQHYIGQCLKYLINLENLILYLDMSDILGQNIQNILQLLSEDFRHLKSLKQFEIQIYKPMNQVNIKNQFCNIQNLIEGIIPLTDLQNLAKQLSIKVNNYRIQINMNYYEQGLQYDTNLIPLKFELSTNQLGFKEDDLIQLVKSLQKIPNINNLYLDLQDNTCKQTKEIFLIQFQEFLEKLPNHLEFLSISLHYKYSKLNTEEIESTFNDMLPNLMNKKLIFN